MNESRHAYRQVFVFATANDCSSRDSRVGYYIVETRQRAVYSGSVGGIFHSEHFERIVVADAHVAIAVDCNDSRIDPVDDCLVVAFAQLGARLRLLYNLSQRVEQSVDFLVTFLEAHCEIVVAYGFEQRSVFLPLMPDSRYSDCSGCSHGSHCGSHNRRRSAGREKQSAGNYGYEDNMF